MEDFIKEAKSNNLKYEYKEQCGLLVIDLHHDWKLAIEHNTINIQIHHEYTYTLYFKKVKIEEIGCHYTLPLYRLKDELFEKIINKLGI